MRYERLVLAELRQDLCAVSSNLSSKGEAMAAANTRSRCALSLQRVAKRVHAVVLPVMIKWWPPKCRPAAGSVFLPLRPSVCLGVGIEKMDFVGSAACAPNSKQRTHTGADLSLAQTETRGRNRQEACQPWSVHPDFIPLELLATVGVPFALPGLYPSSVCHAPALPLTYS